MAKFDYSCYTKAANDKSESLNKDDVQWVNQQILLLDDSLRMHFNKGETKFLSILINLLAIKTAALNAIVYVQDSDKQQLIPTTGYAVKIENKPISIGDQLVGQCASSKEMLHYKNIKGETAWVYVSNTKVHISNLLFIPLIFNEKVFGVMEFRYVTPLTSKCFEFISRAASNIAIILESIQANLSLKLKTKQLTYQEEILKTNINKLEATKAELEKQKKITDDAFKKLSFQSKRLEESISYAQTIQDSILPTEEILKTSFTNAFVLFRPKDVVSGDFYWYCRSGEYQFVAVVDCTGHGVPGAFMSMIGNTLLNQIIIEKRVYEPEIVLSLIHKGIRLNLFKGAKVNQDGMDIMLCRIKSEDDGFNLVAAGAKSCFISMTDDQITLIKGDSKSLGGTYIEKDLEFTQKKLKALTSTKLFFFTDGWIDNANPERKRYGSKRLKQVLRSNSNNPLYIIKQKLIYDMQKYQGNADQRDDITMLGIEL